MYQPRFYRDWIDSSGLVTFEVIDRESDLQIRAGCDLSHRAADLLKDVRCEIEAEIARRPEFASSLNSLPIPPDATPIVRAMYQAAKAWGVGPMAAVAGVVAETVGKGLLQWSEEVIVENGGDIFAHVRRPLELGLYAGDDSPFSGALRLRIAAVGKGCGVCTSSGTVGHSLSLGKADAVVAVARNTAFADAAATAIANRIAGPDDVAAVVNDELERGRLDGLLVVVGKRIGAFGAIQLTQ
jgi:uncharacterized protein